MKIDDDTISVLNNFAKINFGIVIPEGNVLTSISETETTKGIAIVPTLFPRRFAIGNLNRLIGVMSLFKDPEIEFGEKSLVISDGNKKINYVYADESTITSHFKDIIVPNDYCKFTLTKEDFKNIEKAAGVLSLQQIVVRGDGANLYLETSDSSKINGDVYSINIGSTDKTFNAVYKVENFKIMPKTYEVTISSAGVTHLVSENLEYFIVVEAKASHFNK